MTAVKRLLAVAGIVAAFAAAAATAQGAVKYNHWESDSFTAPNPCTGELMDISYDLHTLVSVTVTGKTAVMTYSFEQNLTAIGESSGLQYRSEAVASRVQQQSSLDDGQYVLVSLIRQRWNAVGESTAGDDWVITFQLVTTFDAKGNPTGFSYKPYSQECV